MREPYGNEVEGKSQIVTGEVAEVVDGALPNLMRVFTSSDDAVVFEPVNQGDEEAADQATKYVNHIFYKDNNGFEIMHDWKGCTSSKGWCCKSILGRQDRCYERKILWLKR